MYTLLCFALVQLIESIRTMLIFIQKYYVEYTNKKYPTNTRENNTISAREREREEKLTDSQLITHTHTHTQCGTKRSLYMYETSFVSLRCGTIKLK